ncbi:MAG: DUF4241 domain-containing protein [Kofleriaceae bacterium]|nr:DUF4241 domain-containing protein [Kofleriaceae bacterium]
MAKSKGAAKKPAARVVKKSAAKATKHVEAAKATKPAKATKAAKAVPAPAKAPPKLPAVVVKPKKPTAPSLPLPPPPPPPPPVRDELAAPRDIARLLRYGEPFGPHRIDARMLPLQLPVSSGALAVFDPGVPKSWRVFDRPTGDGQFRVMLSVARTPDKTGTKERLAAVVIHVGRPPIARWTVAHYKGQKKPKDADQLPRVPATTGLVALLDAGTGVPGVVAMTPPAGVQPIEVPLTDGRRALGFASGTGDYAAYWGVDANDKPVCLVLDFDVFTQKDWKAKAT